MGQRAVKSALERWVEKTETRRGRYVPRNRKRKLAARRKRKATRAHKQKLRGR